METSSSSELVKAVAHSCQLYDDAYNNNDPEALAKLFTEDATLVTNTEILHGREAILKYQSDAFKIIKFSNHKGTADLDSIRPLGTDGKDFFAAGTWSQTVQIEDEKPIDMKGFWSAIILNDGTGRDVNGLFFETNLSATSIHRLCVQVSELSGMSSEDWRVEYAPSAEAVRVCGMTCSI